MGKQSRRKTALRASAAERRRARELVAEVEAKGRAILGPEYEARTRRRAREIAEEEGLDPRSPKDPESGGSHARQGQPMACPDHEWVVYSTALREGWLMLQCVECGAMGTIDAPSLREWGEAFHAPSRPYRWHEGSRVHVRGTGPSCVMRSAGGPKCDCHVRLGQSEAGPYERLPVDFMGRPEAITAEERNELAELAEFVGRTDLCSRLLPLFIYTFELETGSHHSRALNSIVDRIEAIDERGHHCSPAVVAAILMWAARVGDADGPRRGPSTSVT